MPHGAVGATGAMPLVSDLPSGPPEAAPRDRKHVQLTYEILAALERSRPD
jgi:hypothetical protein